MSGTMNSQQDLKAILTMESGSDLSSLACTNLEESEKD